MSFINLNIKSWLLYFVIFMLFIFKMNCSMSRFFSMVFYMCCMVNSLCNQLGSKRMAGYNHVLLTIFFYIMIMNLGGLFPLVKSIATHPAFVWSVVIPAWASMTICGFFKMKSGWLSNFMPSGTPMLISFFICLIEILSLLCRPFSLSLRVLVNMTVGHIMLSWHWHEISLAFVDSLMFHYSLSLSWCLYVLLTLFHIWWEIGVSVFQSIVMVGLLSIYCEDFPSVIKKEK